VQLVTRMVVEIIDDHLDVVATRIVVVGHVQRLMHVADKMKNEFKCEQAFLSICPGRRKLCGELRDFIDDAGPLVTVRLQRAGRPAGPEVGPGARRKLYEVFYQAIPDARAEVLDVVAEGDKS
jgi:hypothetical protein